MPVPEKSRVPFGPNSMAESSEKPGTLQELFNRFDRGTMSVGAFERSLCDLGFKVTPELERLLAAYGQSCSFKFSDLVKALSRPQHVHIGLPAVRPVTVSEAIKQTVSGNFDADEFKEFLTSQGVRITEEMDRLIRSHLADGSRTYQDFAVQLKREGIELTKPHPSFRFFRNSH